MPLMVDCPRGLGYVKAFLFIGICLNVSSNQVIFVQRVDRARYSAWVDEAATCDCFVLPHWTGHPFMRIMNPVLDLLFFSSPYDASTYAFIFNGEEVLFTVFVAVIVLSMVPFRYRRIFFASWKWWLVYACVY